MSLDLTTVITFAIYLAAMVSVGFWVYRRTTNVSDFVIGGRSLNGWVAALSAQASDFSGWLLLGLPGAAYIGGVSAAAWIAIGLVLGNYFAWKVIAARLRLYTERAGAQKVVGGSVTLSSYFENRFEDQSHFLRIVSAVIIVFFFSVYVASGLVAAGLLFNELFGLDIAIAISIAAGVIVLYTFLGGFNAVSFTDVLQGSLMWFAVIAVPLQIIVLMGGFDEFLNSLTEYHPELLSVTSEVQRTESREWVTGGSIGGIGVASALAWGLGYFGQPHILARFMGLRSIQSIPKARLLAVSWSVTGLIAATFVGLAGIVYLGDRVRDPEGVYILLIQESLNPWAGGLLLAAILAAIMSTADSQLLVASSALSEDFYRAFINKDASQASLLWAGRVTVIGMAIAAWVLALNGGAIPDLVGYAWAGFGATFGPIILLSLFWRKMNRTGAIAGMIAGALGVVIWGQLDPFGWGLYEMVPGFVANFLAIVTFNRFGAVPSKRMLRDFDSVQNMIVDAEVYDWVWRPRLSTTGDD
jgi:sodium/proline symporter